MPPQAGPGAVGPRRRPASGAGARGAGSRVGAAAARRVGSAASGCGWASGAVSAPEPGSVTRWRTTMTGHQPEAGSPGRARTSISAPPRRPSRAGSSTPPTKSYPGEASARRTSRLRRARSAAPGAGAISVHARPSSSAQRDARWARCVAASARRMATPGSSSARRGAASAGPTGRCSRCTRRRHRVVAAASRRTGRGATAADAAPSGPSSRAVVVMSSSLPRAPDTVLPATPGSRELTARDLPVQSWAREAAPRPRSH